MPATVHCGSGDDELSASAGTTVPVARPAASSVAAAILIGVCILPPFSAAVALPWGRAGLAVLPLKCLKLNARGSRLCPAWILCPVRRGSPGLRLELHGPARAGLRVDRSRVPARLVGDYATLV